VQSETATRNEVATRRHSDNDVQRVQRIPGCARWVAKDTAGARVWRCGMAGDDHGESPAARAAAPYSTAMERAGGDEWRVERDARKQSWTICRDPSVHGSATGDGRRAGELGSRVR
jgi:hypothetical protein